jgi:hypothetical protein
MRGEEPVIEAGENDRSCEAWEYRSDDHGPILERKVSGFAEALKQQFREVVKALTRHAPAPEPPRRKRTEETRGAFTLAARKIFRRAFVVPSAAFSAAAYLWDTIDWLNPLHGYDAAMSDEFSENFEHTESHHLYPRL